MTNIATALKAEISRVARKEVRAETAALKKAATLYGSEIAALKRRAAALEQELRKLGKTQRNAKPAEEPESPHAVTRFSAKGFATQRRRLALSAQDCGLLLGASGQSVYNWEDGKSRPGASFRTAIAALKTLTKKQAEEILVTRRANA